MRAPFPYAVCLEAFDQSGVVDETKELENVGAGDRKAEIHGGHGALPSSRVVAGSAAESSEPTSGTA